MEARSSVHQCAMSEAAVWRCDHLPASPEHAPGGANGWTGFYEGVLSFNAMLSAALGRSLAFSGRISLEPEVIRGVVNAAPRRPWNKKAALV